jgi:hypothetical protein
VANDELALIEGTLSTADFLAKWEESINAAIAEAIETGVS